MSLATATSSEANRDDKHGHHQVSRQQQQLPYYPLFTTTATTTTTTPPPPPLLLLLLLPQNPGPTLHRRLSSRLPCKRVASTTRWALISTPCPSITSLRCHVGIEEEQRGTPSLHSIVCLYFSFFFWFLCLDFVTFLRTWLSSLWPPQISTPGFSPRNPIRCVAVRTCRQEVIRKRGVWVIITVNRTRGRERNKDARAYIVLAWRPGGDLRH